MSYLFNIIIVTFFLGVIACNGSNKTGKTDIKFDSIGHGYYAAFDEQRTLVINDDKEFAKLWEDVYANLDQAPRIPDVDLKKYSVAAVFMGAQKSGGFDIKITGVTGMNEKLVIDVTATSPGINCMVTDGITKPYDVVKIPKTDLGYEFKFNNEVKDCQ